MPPLTGTDAGVDGRGVGRGSAGKMVQGEGEVLGVCADVLMGNVAVWGVALLKKLAAAACARSRLRLRTPARPLTTQA